MTQTLPQPTTPIPQAGGPRPPAAAAPAHAPAAQPGWWARARSHHKPDDIARFTRELASLVEAKVPLDQGLLAIAEHERDAHLRWVLLDIAGRIEAGESIAAAVGQHRAAFGDVYIESMRAAEQSGQLEQVLVHLADLLERQAETRKQLRRALTYPVIVLSFVAIAMVVIITVVIPRFAVTFEASGVELPLITRVLRSLGDSMRSAWWAYAAGAAGAVFAIAMAWQTPRGRALFERLALAVPVVGRLIVAVTAARFGRVLAISLDSGLGLIESIRIAAGSTGRPLFVMETAVMVERLRSGEPLANVLADSHYLPPFARRMIGAGRGAADVGRSGSIVARHYDREADHLTKTFNTLIEPLMTVGLAAVVLVVALAVFLPMWQLVRVRG